MKKGKGGRKTDEFYQGKGEELRVEKGEGLMVVGNGGKVKGGGKRRKG